MTIADLNAGEKGHVTLHKAIRRRLLDVRDFGVVGDGIADDTAAIAAALAAGCGVFPPGGFVFSQMVVPAGVSITGAGSHLTRFFPTGNGAGITNAAPWLRQTFSGFSVVHKRNTHSGNDLVLVAYGMADCAWNDVQLYGVAGVTRDGLRIPYTNPVTGAGNHNYFNRLTGVDFDAETPVDGVALNLLGSTETSFTGVNSNMVTGGVFRGWKTSIHIIGAGNTFIGTNINPSAACGVLIEDAQVSRSNTFVNCWWDDRENWRERMLICRNDRPTVHVTYQAYNTVAVLGGEGIQGEADVIKTGAYPEWIKAGIYL